ncbi:MAG: tyrosine-protein phosphatase [Clostridiales bacterium]|jgi:protein-tyrosine phosphatase|nr:tyrosine-protein phosphatase [Clostridiales bacterium]
MFKMEKIINFRELGGIPVDGGRVKAGVFFRSAELDFATERDIEELNGLGIRTVLDFRDDSEKINPDVYDKIKADYYNVPVRAENAKIIKLRQRPDLKTFMSLSGKDACEIYGELPFNNPSYVKLFELLREGKTPILFHCTAGKDRTGIAAALILLLLGAKKDDIVRDYIVTKAAVPALKARMLKDFHFLLRGFIGKRMQPLIDADEKYISAAIDAVYKKYGTAKEYFRAEYGYDEETVRDIKKRYVQSFEE